MSSPTLTPEAMLEHLRKTVTSNRTIRTLETVYEVCLEHKKRGETDFTYAMIARVGEKRGIPRVQSIRNKTGEPYRLLINSFRDSLLPIQKEKSTPAKSADWIDNIENPNLRLLVKVQEAELKKAQRQLREIKPLPDTITVNDYIKLEQRFNSSERTSLEYLLSDEFIKDNEGVAHGSRGDLYGGERRLFKPGTFDAIRKALEVLS